MKIFIVLLLTIFLTPAIWSDVDIIIQAHDDWRDDLADISNWTKKDFIDYWNNTHYGEIISVLPVRIKHGNECCNPNEGFLTVTVTGVTLEQARDFLAPLEDISAVLGSDTVMVRQRMYYFSKPYIETAIAQWENTGERLVITKQQVLNNIKQITVQQVKQSILNRKRRYD